jgi:hypothetical protein
VGKLVVLLRNLMKNSMKIFGKIQRILTKKPRKGRPENPTIYNSNKLLAHRKPNSIPHQAINVMPCP